MVRCLICGIFPMAVIFVVVSCVVAQYKRVGSTSTAGGSGTAVAPVGPATVVAPVGPTLVPNGGRNLQNNTVPGLKLLGHINNQGIYLGTQAATQPEAIKICAKLSTISGQPGYMAALDGRDTPKLELYELLKEKANDVKDFWITGRIELRPDGKEFWVLEGPFPRREEDVTGRGLYLGFKSKRHVRLFKPQGSLFVTTRGKREGDEQVITSEGPVTINETHYPWLPQWNGTDAGACHLKECKPRQCKVTTPQCTLRVGKCEISRKTKCQLIGNQDCTVIPKQCNITQPKCVVYPTSCPLKTPRKCRVEPPTCTVLTYPCTVERPPCVTKYPPCHVATENVTCAPTPCATISESDLDKCERRPRECTAEEVAAGRVNCTYYHCPTEQTLCLKPDVCRQNVLKCPAPYTFCPPVKVQCRAPYVNCSRPKTICTPPEFNCSYPNVICEQPAVECTDEIHICPPPKTKCFPQPEVTCPRAEVSCPPPQLECDEPKPCIPVYDSPCVEHTCKENCNCMKLRCYGIWLEPQHRYDVLGARCDERHRALCVTTFK